jgi:uncharacterized membrane protein YhaH (DUF805 family)
MQHTMTFQQSIRSCLTKYAEFDGRATRSELWWFLLFVVLVSTALGILDDEWSAVFLIGMLLPTLSAGARRLHDSGRSGWWQLIALVPVAGIVVLALLWAQPALPRMPESVQTA